MPGGVLRVRGGIGGQAVHQRLGVVRAAGGEEGQRGDGVREPLTRRVGQRAQIGAPGRRASGTSLASTATWSATAWNRADPSA